MRKLKKIVKIKEVKIHIFWDTWWISMKFLGKMYFNMILKVTKKESFTLSLDSMFFLNTFWRLRDVVGFFNKSLILVFAELAIFHSI